jgi:hypothetical protein
MKFSVARQGAALILSATDEAGLHPNGGSVGQIQFRTLAFVTPTYRYEQA